MYYPIAEEELQVVQDCMQQISLLVDLGSGISAVQTTVGTEALLSFLIAQREALQGAVEAVQAREVMRGPAG
ncbi:hypothetical protein Daci_4492 [Delftia acidovorans SPH-1]|uniref:Uncharacterized protein n=1 Tax=Delftia acidovorans (strain DSM 14801 / SPH-1) TaxID=398578 RepID=A9C0P8_DELAS|nr:MULTISPECIES: hypothetical protein [Delftia]MCP4016989.1 hypothetical protein [Delftia sp.]OLE94665.1 MAG: hypothetical protein AUI84_08100 [Delftia sp. 13_1_40CM_3_66_6]HLB78155.1 hypothetical protein [Candidatus Dormibacteraeota bacterium]ABX37121.1 hypothetical protein Daci_4492 [Delftia acidovorans SPH-1]MBN9322979.1 hypothetical protein [Delftia acidovorans]